jgi:hypothetical protein
MALTPDPSAINKLLAGPTALGLTKNCVYFHVYGKDDTSVTKRGVGYEEERWGDDVRRWKQELDIVKERKTRGEKGKWGDMLVEED